MFYPVDSAQNYTGVSEKRFGKGWDVTIVTVDELGLDYYALDPAVKRIALGLAGDSVGAMAALVGNVRRALAVRRVLKRIRPDVAVAMMTQSNVLLALASLGLRGVFNHTSQPWTSRRATWRS